MKKFVILSVFLLIAIFKLASGQNPIPSWSTPVAGETCFSEIPVMEDSSAQHPDGKRTLHVHSQVTANGPAGCGSVIVFCLQTLESYGPAEICPGETLEFEVNKFDWGVIVEWENEGILDIWIENE